MRSRFPSYFAAAHTVAIALAVALLASCAGRVDTTILKDGGARVILKSEIPQQLALRIRDFGRIPATTPLFDPETARSSLDARPGVKVESMDAPTKESINATVLIADMKRLTSEGDIADAKLASITKDKGWTELRIRLSRDNAKAVYRLIPGIDKRLVEALSPPALEEDPVTPAEYRLNLETAVIGKKAMPSFDQAGVDITIKAPSALLGSGGGKVSGSTLSLRIKLFDLLTLEKPIEFWLRWKE